MRERVTVLIIAKPGQVRDGLRALLHAMPGVDVVDRPCDGMINVDLLAEYNPALILVDCRLVDMRTLDALRRLKTQNPGVCFLILVEDVEQQQLAQDTGFEHVMIKGSSAEKLAKTVRELLTHKSKVGRSE